MSSCFGSEEATAWKRCHGVPTPSEFPCDKCCLSPRRHPQSAPTRNRPKLREVDKSRGIGDDASSVSLDGGMNVPLVVGGRLRSVLVGSGGGRSCKGSAGNVGHVAHGGTARQRPGQ